MRKLGFIQFIVLLALVIICYYPSVQGGFIWDDLDYVAQNKALRSGDGLKAIWLNPNATPNYYPLFFTSLWVQYQLWAENVIGYHIVNIVFHIFNALLIWYLLGRLKIAGAYLIALLFAIHPVNVESVAWISELKNTQSTFFVLLSILSFHAFIKKEDVLTSVRGFFGKRTMFFLLSLLAFLCAVMTKTVTVILCGVFLIIYWLEDIKLKRAQILSLAPFILAGAPFVFLFMRSEHHYMMMVDAPVTIPFWERLLMVGRVFWFYPLKLIWPDPLMFIYPKWKVDPTNVVPYLYLAGIVLLFVFLVIKRNSIPKGVIAGSVYYCLVVAPASGLLEYQNLRHAYVADHFQYLPSIGLLAILVNAVIYAQRKWPVFGHFLVKAVLLGSVVSCFCLLSFLHAGDFKSRIAVYSDTLSKDWNNPFAYNLRGRAYVDKGYYDLALADFSQAVLIDPQYRQALNNRAVVYVKFGKYQKALDDIDRVLKINPSDRRAIHSRELLMKR